MSEPFRLSRRSLRTLLGVHPILIRIVERAIELTDCDFAVSEGTRTHKRQRQLMRAKKSRTVRSRHLPGVPAANPEYGPVAHAVDLTAWVDDAVSWDWPHYFQIADAMAEAASEQGVTLEWGGGWCSLADYSCARDAHEAYIQRCEDEGRKPFADGPHFQLSWGDYPLCP